MELLQTIRQHQLGEGENASSPTKIGNASVLMNRLNSGMMHKVSGSTQMQGLFKQRLAAKFVEKQE
jgi:hypothetical protein